MTIRCDDVSKKITCIHICNQTSITIIYVLKIVKNTFILGTIYIYIYVYIYSYWKFSYV